MRHALSSGGMMPSGNASVLDKESGADRLETKIVGGLKGGLATGNYLHGCRHCSALRPFTACFGYSRGRRSLRLLHNKLDSVEMSDLLFMEWQKTIPRGQISRRVSDAPSLGLWLSPGHCFLCWSQPQERIRDGILRDNKIIST